MQNYTSNKNRIPMYSQTGKVVGWVTNNILQKNADANKHMLQKPQGWAWDKSVLDRAIELGAIKTIIHDKNLDMDFCANLDDFYTRGRKINRGFGEQFVLPLMFWEIHQSGKPQTKQLAFNFEGGN